MENFVKETTAVVNGKVYKAQVSLMDIEKMNDYDQAQRVLVDKHNLLCRKRRWQLWLSVLVILTVLIVAEACADSYFGASDFWASPFVRCLLLLPPALVVFSLIYFTALISGSEMYYSTPCEFVQTLELAEFLGNADLTHSLLVDPGYISEIDAICRETRLLENFTFVGMDVRYHDRDCVLIEGFMEEPGTESGPEYCLRMVLPLEVRIDEREG